MQECAEVCSIPSPRFLAGIPLTPHEAKTTRQILTENEEFSVSRILRRSGMETYKTDKKCSKFN